MDTINESTEMSILDPENTYWDGYDVNERYNFFMAPESKMMRNNLKCLLPLFPSKLTYLYVDDIIYPEEHSRDQLREILYTFTYWNDLLIEQLCNMSDMGIPLAYIVVEDAEDGISLQVMRTPDIIQPIGAQNFQRVHYNDICLA